MITNSQSVLDRDATTTAANGHATGSGYVTSEGPTHAEQVLRTNERRMRRQNEAFQAAIIGAPLEESLAILARIVTDTDPEARLGFHIADRDAACLHPIRIRGGGIPDSYMDAVDNFPIGEDSLGCGLALATGEAVITPDVFEDARWKKMNVLDLPRAHGWRACWSFPIVTPDILPVGTFYRYFAEVREPTPDDLAATGMVTQAAAIIISRHSQAQQRAQAEQQARDSEERYRLLTSIVTDVPWTTDADGQFVTPQDAYARYTGKPWDELRGLGWVQCIHPDDREELTRIWNQAVATRSNYFAPCREWHGPTQQWRHVIARGTPVLNADGSVREWVGSLTDVHEQKVAEEALRESEMRYRTLFDTIDEGFCIIEFLDGPHGPLSDYVHVEANPAYERHAGIPNIVGQKLREMVPNEADGWAELYRQVLLTGDPIRFQRELVATRRQLELFAFRVEPKSRRQVAVLFQDITARKQAEKALQHHQEMLEDLVRQRTEEVKTAERGLATTQRMAAVGTLASGLAHDMSNVLFPLGTRLDMLVAHASVDGATHDHLTAVQGLVAHLREMSRNLSLFSRDPEKEGIVGQTDLTDWSSRAWHFIEKSLRTPGDGSASIEIDCDVPKGLPKLGIAPHRFTQIIQNLIHNARDAVLARRALPGGGGDSSYRGRIALTARNGSGIVLTISDDGIGMDEETKRRCTEPFFTTRNRPDAIGGAGSGMGLALVHSIVERCGGSMDIESSTKPPQQGTTITMRFPVKAD